MDGVPGVASIVRAGTLQLQGIGAYGDGICNLLPQYEVHYGTGQSAYYWVAWEFTATSGLTKLLLTGNNAALFVSLAK